MDISSWIIIYLGAGLMISIAFGIFANNDSIENVIDNSLYGLIVLLWPLVTLVLIVYLLGWVVNFWIWQIKK